MVCLFFIRRGIIHNPAEYTYLHDLRYHTIMSMYEAGPYIDLFDASHGRGYLLLDGRGEDGFQRGVNNF